MFLNFQKLFLYTNLLLFQSLNKSVLQLYNKENHMVLVMSFLHPQ